MAAGIKAVDLAKLKGEGIEKRQVGHDFVYRYPPSPRMPFLDVKQLGQHLVEDLPKHKELAYYVHVPFCTALCTFCHYFKTKPGFERETKQYLGCIKREAEEYARLLGRKPKPVALFFGGGTPTVLEPEQLQDLVAFFSEHFGIGRKTEATVEASPDTLDLEKAAKLRECFNRISIGIQTLDDSLQEKFFGNRTSRQSFRAFDAAREAGFENINVDLMYGLPKQTLQSWESTVQKLVEMQPESVTASDLRIMNQARHADACSPGEMLQMYAFFVEEMLGQGYVQQFPYQFVKKGKEMRFLENQWSNGSFIGIGASSCSYLANWDYNNWFPNVEYMKAVEEAGISAAIGKRLGSRERMLRAVVLGLKKSGLNRKSPGIDKLKFKKQFKISIEEAFPKQLEKLESLGLMNESERFFALGEKGLFFHDEIGKLFFEKK